MQLPGRHGSLDSYRYGFQGQEKDDEIKGEGNSINYKYRMHDPRVGRFFAVDPLKGMYPYYSPYQFSGNRVIDRVELEGLEQGLADALFVYTSKKMSKAIEKTIADENLNSTENQTIQILKYYSIDVGTDLASWTDIDDAVIIATTILPEESGPVNVKGETADIVDKAFAFGGVLIPFVSGSTVKKGIKKLFGLGKKTDQILLSANEIWKKSKFERGRLIEESLTKSGFYKGFTRTSDLLTKNDKTTNFFPYIDFVKGNIAVSVKSTNAKSGFKNIYDNIENLKSFVKNSATNGDELIDDVRLDIFVPEGYDKSLLEDVVQTAEDAGIKASVIEFKD